MTGLDGLFWKKSMWNITLTLTILTALIYPSYRKSEYLFLSSIMILFSVLATILFSDLEPILFFEINFYVPFMLNSFFNTINRLLFA